MAIEVRVKMLRDVGGFDAGAYRTMKVVDAERLEARGVVAIVSKPARPKPAVAKKVRGSKKAAAPKNKMAAPAKNKSA